VPSSLTDSSLLVPHWYFSCDSMALLTPPSLSVSPSRTRVPLGIEYGRCSGFRETICIGKRRRYARVQVIGGHYSSGETGMPSLVQVVGRPVCSVGQLGLWRL
jgi:hypothetical protein